MSSNLMNEMEVTRQLLHKAVDQVDWTDKQIYGSFIAQTYFYVCHSTRLLALAASGLDLYDRKSFKRFVDHIREETNHEILAERDLKALGYTLSDFQELESTKASYRMQYYYMQNGSQWSLLGHVQALENLAADRGSQLAEIVTKQWGKEAAGFLRVHGAEDVKHLEEAMKLINALEPDAQKEVVESMKMSRFLYTKMLQDLRLGIVSEPAQRKTA